MRFTSDLAEATRECEAIFIAVGTPQGENGDADLSYVEAVASEIARTLTSYKVIVEKSTVPVYTNEWIRRVIERQRRGAGCCSMWCRTRSFCVKGRRSRTFCIRTGSLWDRKRAGLRLCWRQIYAPLTTGSYYTGPGAIAGMCSYESPPPLLDTSTKSAEIIKHASNAFLAMKISFINAVANLCEAADANVEQVARGMGLDRRIGGRFLRPGIGYGGSCFPKDVAAFRSVAEQLGIDFSLLTEVERINASQKKRFLAKVRSALWTLRGKRLAVLGLAFKGETDDIRESPAIDMIEMLLAEGCCIYAFDPAAMPRAQAELPGSAVLHYCTSAYDAAADADALLILTDWQEFGTLDLPRLNKTLRYPIVIDGRNLYDPQVMQQHGFTYLSVGRPAAHPVREPVSV